MSLGDGTQWDGSELLGLKQNLWDRAKSLLE